VREASDLRDAADVNSSAAPAVEAAAVDEVATADMPTSADAGAAMPAEAATVRLTDADDEVRQAPAVSNVCSTAEATPAAIVDAPAADAAADAPAADDAATATATAIDDAHAKSDADDDGAVVAATPTARTPSSGFPAKKASASREPSSAGKKKTPSRTPARGTPALRAASLNGATGLGSSCRATPTVVALASPAVAPSSPTPLTA
jgi:hypothetical protein